MGKQAFAAAAAAMAIVTLSAASASADFFVGSPGGPDCIPFGCASSDPSYAVYQQVYDIGGDAQISQVVFPTTRGDYNPTGLDGLFYTSKVVGGLSTDPTVNRGAPLQFMILASGQPAWVYNPALGNLLLQVLNPYKYSFDGVGFPTAFATTGALTSSLYVFAGMSTGTVSDIGLYTRFNTVPEPATWAMLILGFFGLGSAVRVRNSGGRRQEVQHG